MELRHKDRSITNILGMTGQGKSIMRRALTSKERVNRLFVFDPQMEDESVYYYSDIEELLRDYQENKFTDSSFRVGCFDVDVLENLATIAYISGECTMVVEECSIAFQSTAKLSYAFKEIVFMGRHQNVSLITTAQRAVSVPIALRSQATRCISFAQHEDRDISWLKAYYGDRVKEIPFLEKLQCLDSERGQIFKYFVDIPK